MDDTAVRRYFTQPTHIYHRRYEALRAVIVEGRSQKEVAEELGFQYHSLRQLVYEFRHSFDASQAANESPFFATSVSDISRQSQRSPRNRSSRIDRLWCCPVRSRCVYEHERRGSSCSSRCWPNWDSTRWFAGRAIRERRWFPRTRRCSACSR